MLRLTSFVISLPLLAGSVFAGGNQVTREFRPLEARKVTIQTAGKVEALPKSESRSALRLAWSHFDAKEWNDANEAFVRALAADPDSREAAEGLAMSIYQSGDLASAYRLGEELKIVMPNVSRIVASTALTDAQGFIAKGKFSEARSLLSHFPATSPTLVYAHHLVETADTLTTAVREQEASLPEESLARN